MSAVKNINAVMSNVAVMESDVDADFLKREAGKIPKEQLKIAISVDWLIRANEPHSRSKPQPRPLNVFFLHRRNWVDFNRPLYEERGDDFSINKVTSLIREEWNNASDPVRQFFMWAEKCHKDKHKERYPDYQFRKDGKKKKQGTAVRANVTSKNPASEDSATNDPEDIAGSAKRKSPYPQHPKPTKPTKRNRIEDDDATTATDVLSTGTSHNIAANNSVSLATTPLSMSMAIAMSPEYQQNTITEAPPSVNISMMNFLTSEEFPQIFTNDGYPLLVDQVQEAVGCHNHHYHHHHHFYYYQQPTYAMYPPLDSVEGGYYHESNINEEMLLGNADETANEILQTETESINQDFEEPGSLMGTPTTSSSSVPQTPVDQEFDYGWGEQNMEPNGYVNDLFPGINYY